MIRRETEPKYDRTITTFSEDGRLLQVEYGMKAASRGDTVAAMATDDLCCVSVSSSDKVHRIDRHILLVTSGLVGDGLAMAAALRNACQRHRLSLGEAPTVQEVSRMAAQIQHDLTRTSGNRPLGCTCIIIGIDTSFDDEVPGVVRLFQTEPGGIVEECRFCAAGKNSAPAMSSLESLHEVIVKLQDQTDVVREACSGVVRAVLSETSTNPSGGRQTADLWMLRSDPNRPGKQHLLCVKGIDETSANQAASVVASDVS